MDQDPIVTLAWALKSLENAIHQLKPGRAEDRVRRQFHQLLLAFERETFAVSSLTELENGKPPSRHPDK